MAGGVVVTHDDGSYKATRTIRNENGKEIDFEVVLETHHDSPVAAILRISTTNNITEWLLTPQEFAGLYETVAAAKSISNACPKVEDTPIGDDGRAG